MAYLIISDDLVVFTCSDIRFFFVFWMFSSYESYLYTSLMCWTNETTLAVKWIHHDNVLMPRKKKVILLLFSNVLCICLTLFRVFGGLSCIEDFKTCVLYCFSNDTERCMVESFTDINKALLLLPLSLIFMFGKILILLRCMSIGVSPSYLHWLHYCHVGKKQTSLFLMVFLALQITSRFNTTRRRKKMSEHALQNLCFGNVCNFREVIKSKCTHNCVKSLSKHLRWGTHGTLTSTSLERREEFFILKSRMLLRNFQQVSPWGTSLCSPVEVHSFFFHVCPEHL